MTGNDLVLLDGAFDEWRAGLTNGVPEDKAFEIFASTYALQELDLSTDEITQGVLGGGDDGGIDAAYVLLDEKLLAEDSDELSDEFGPGKVKRGSELCLFLVQAKRTPSFSESALDKASSSTNRLLDLTKQDSDLAELYSPELLLRIELFRKALSKFASRHLKVSVEFFYVTRGSTLEANAKVLVKCRDFEAQLRKVTTGATASAELLGASELWERFDAVPNYTLQLTYQESATSGNSHIALVTLREYLKFLKDDSENLRRYIFDWNVRDYQGDVEVNREISASVRDVEGPEFWWLNNGITIVCSQSSIVSKTFILDDVQVVNGLQTSHTLFNTLRDVEEDDPTLDRLLLVRILVAGDNADVRDKVIRATNRQTTVPAASLRATDEIQRKLEAFFHAHGWYYDRRKNYYRNQGKPASRIIGIPLLAQSVMAMGLGRPDNSRARPSSLLKKDDDYRRVFDPELPLNVYLWFAKTQKTVDSFLLSDASEATSTERTNLRFHLAMLIAAVIYGGRIFNPAQLKAVASADAPIDPNFLFICLDLLREEMNAIILITGSAADKVAKGPELVAALNQRGIQKLTEALEGN